VARPEVDLVEPVLGTEIDAARRHEAQRASISPATVS